MDNSHQTPKSGNNIPTAQPSQKSFTPFIFWGILLLILVAIGAYYLGVSNRTTSIPPQILQIQPSPTTANNNMIISTNPTQIISRSPTPSIKKMQLESTEGWQTITYKGVSFKIPPKAAFENGYYYYDASLRPNISPTQIDVEQYSGGSRREQFLGNTSYNDCHWMFEDAYFGNVEALQIAADGGFCQGGNVGGIVTIAGDKFVIFRGLYYDLNTKIIPNNLTWNSVVSTVQLAH